MVAFVLSSSSSTLFRSRKASPTCTRRNVLKCVAEVDVNREGPDLSKADFPIFVDRDERVAAVKKLSQKFHENGRPVPDVETMEWFLADRRYDVEKTYEKLGGMLKWREALVEVPGDSVEREYHTGKAYLYPDLDKHGRKVLIVRASKHITNQFPFESSERLIQKMMDDAVEDMTDGTETILGVVDMRGFAMKNSDVKLAQLLVDVFFTYYPRRLSELLVVDAPLVFQPMWQVIKPLLKKYSALVRFVRKDQLTEHFDGASAKRFMADFD
uniref:CRAL-TRIO domain-containing protein n=2 Tax=Rhodosorus marinus TaxID=101924 RepID=A0A7S3ECH6_9RHOD|mmetsp:Transcript_21975/g.89280  ORF Transcript_21975/g.89280 Transcript_21975/m.89280 type:complete len:270 (+) Transcript_21975:255-1064(+)|eukprot:CAMPEP_0113966558 /NCGR_PEP_ID=MMETSP0011_2-20120614/8394_1 /TAXON_ID=101924 /ORGANISM="Rhodosorus marinus" /LENGTH=269 /DNA_ID=CAMNT_0000979249 /DNA_START=25 /DNA_END=834 /DNA_ORIENTATION=- /assembly_acc=CAM_ASM_000156